VSTFDANFRSIIASAKSIFTGSVSAVALAQTTTADVYLSVTTGGSDAYNVARDPIAGGDYTAYPYLTLQAAIDACPKVIRHNIFISIGQGQFVGANINGFIGGGYDSSGYPIGIYLTGTAANITPATGVASGTAGSGTTTTSVVKPTAAADWTASDLVGRFLKVTGGAGYISADRPIYRPIKANTTTALTVDAVASMDNTTTFALVDAQSTFLKQSVSDLVPLRITNNTAPISIRMCAFYDASPLDYHIYSQGNKSLFMDSIHESATTTFNNIYSIRDGDVSLSNTIFSTGSNYKVEQFQGYATIANIWLNASGPLTLLNGLNGKVTKVNSLDAPSYVFSATNMNFLQAEVTANSGDATPIYLESISSFENIGGGLTGTGNVGTGCYGLQIEKAGRYTLTSSSVTGDDGDVLWMGSETTWAILNSPDYGIVSSVSGNAVGNGAYTKSIVYGNFLIDGSQDFSSRINCYGYINQSSPLGVSTLTGTQNFNCNNGTVDGVSTGYGNALAFLQITCNSATATCDIPSGAAIAGCQWACYNSGSQPLTLTAPSGGSIDGIGTYVLAAGAKVTMWSLNGGSGKDWVVTAEL
jgi:hypothetical protein